MAKRRMFSEDVLESDNFIFMSCEAQALYMHMCMTADDDGFVGGKRRAMTLLRVTESAYNELKNGGFIIEFESGVIAVTHWKANNKIKKDRYTPTVYKKEFEQLDLSDDFGYALKRQEENIQKEKTEEKQREAASSSSVINNVKEAESMNDIPLPDDSDAPPEEDVFSPVTEVKAAAPELKLLGGGSRRLSVEEYETLKRNYPEMDINKEIREINDWFSSAGGRLRDEASVMWYFEDWLAKKRIRQRESNSDSAPLAQKGEGS